MKRTKTKKVKVVNEKTLIVALDIGKKVHYGYFRAPRGDEVVPFPFHNSGHSFKILWGKICKFKREQKLEEIVIGFESSGPYAEPLCDFFRRKPVKLVQTNPMHTKRLKELTGNSPNKTDWKDPRVIADLILLGHALTVVIPEGAAAELRRLIHTRERAQKLFEAAQTSVGIALGKQSIIIEINHIVSKIESERQFIERLEKLMDDYLKEISYSQSILSIRGIGTVTTAGMIGEVGDFKKFNTINEITKLAGLDLMK